MCGRSQFCNPIIQQRIEISCWSTQQLAAECKIHQCKRLWYHAKYIISNPSSYPLVIIFCLKHLLFGGESNFGHSSCSFCSHVCALEFLGLRVTNAGCCRVARNNNQITCFGMHFIQLRLPILSLLGELTMLNLHQMLFLLISIA